MSAIAARYGTAFAEAVLAEPTMQPQDALGQLRGFEAALVESPDLRNVLASPAVPPVQKRAVVEGLSEVLGLSRLTRNLISVLIDHRRTALLRGPLARAVEAVFDERMGRVRVEVASAVELTPEQKQRLESALSRTAAKHVRCEYGVEPSLVGGVLARIRSRVYDGSVRGRLNHLREKLR